MPHALARGRPDHYFCQKFWAGCCVNLTLTNNIRQCLLYIPTSGIGVCQKTGLSQGFKSSEADCIHDSPDRGDFRENKVRRLSIMTGNRYVCYYYENKQLQGRTLALPERSEQRSQDDALFRLNAAIDLGQLEPPATKPVVLPIKPSSGLLITLKRQTCCYPHFQSLAPIYKL